MIENINIRNIGKYVKDCDDFEDVWVGHNYDIEKIDVICAIHRPDASKELFEDLRRKIAVNVARETGTRFVENHVNIEVINYL